MDLRRRLLSGLSGRVVEVGAGNGLNFAHYPAAVTSVLAVEPEPHLRRLAARRARRATVAVHVVPGRAAQLPAAAASADAVVFCLVLCSVPHQNTALAEARRVLRPGGQLRFLEHVAADTGGLAAVQRLLDATIWPTLGGGCHASRDTLSAIVEAGFLVEHVDRFRFPDMRLPLPSSPHILGEAART